MLLEQAEAFRFLRLELRFVRVETCRDGLRGLVEGAADDDCGGRIAVGDRDAQIPALIASHVRERLVGSDGCNEALLLQFRQDWPMIELVEPLELARASPLDAVVVLCGDGFRGCSRLCRRRS